jgi:lysylphosphatidylglycerol synthetase-like protein (DUF2156 family)
MIDARKFTRFFILYILTSIIISFTVAFTSAAWIVYAFTILPFYLICVLYCLSSCMNRDTKFTFKSRSWFAILICQLLFILTSSADCYLWSQGRACYSLVQTYLDRTKLDPPHWTVVEAIFPIALLSYIILMINALRKTRIVSQLDN